MLMRVEGARATEEGVNAQSKLLILRGCGWDAVPGRGESLDAQARTPGSPVRLPTSTRAGLGAGEEDDPGLVQEYPALCLLQLEECAARPAGVQQPSSLSSQPGPPWGRQGPGAKGRRPASARGPGLCGNPAGAAATAAWRREAARSVLEKFVGPEPSAPPHKPAPLKQAGDEA